MGSTTQIVNRQGVMAPGQIFDSGPLQVGPAVTLGVGTHVGAALRDTRLFMASDAAGTMEVFQAKDFTSINTFPTPPAGRVQTTTIPYVPGVGVTPAPINLSAPYIRFKYTNGGVASTFTDLWSVVTED
jgi:hypothetical protein